MDFLRASNLSIKFKPDIGSFDSDGKIPCETGSREMFIIKDDVAVLDNEQLVIFRQQNRSAGDYERLTFTSAEYCIDRVSLVDDITLNHNRSHKKRASTTTMTTTTTVATTTAKNWNRVDNSSTAGDTQLTYTYVALARRPCSKMTCVPKCCLMGQMLQYNDKHNVVECQKALSADNATAAIRMKLANGTELRSESPPPPVVYAIL